MKTNSSCRLSNAPDCNGNPSSCNPSLEFNASDFCIAPRKYWLADRTIWDEYADLMETAATPGLTNSNPFIVNEAAKTLGEPARDDAQISAQLAYSNEPLDREQTAMQGQLTSPQTQSTAKNTACGYIRWIWRGNAFPYYLA